MAKMRLAVGSVDVVIREENVGSASNRICYPGISSCVTVTGVGPSGMVGCHITFATEPDLVSQMFQAMRTGGGTSCVHFYVIGKIADFKRSRTYSSFNTRKKMGQAIKDVICETAVVRFCDSEAYGKDIHIMVQKNLMNADFSWVATAGNVVAGDLYPAFAGAAISPNDFVAR